MSVCVRLFFYDCRVEDLLATHQHALDRITSIYQFFKSFESEHDKEMRVLGDLNVYARS